MLRLRRREVVGPTLLTTPSLISPDVSKPAWPFLTSRPSQGRGRAGLGSSPCVGLGLNRARARCMVRRVRLEPGLDITSQAGPGPEESREGKTRARTVWVSTSHLSGSKAPISRTSPNQGPLGFRA